MQPLQIFLYKTKNSPTPLRTIEIIRNNRSGLPYDQPSRAATPRDIYTSTEHLREIPNKEKVWKKWLWFALLALCLLLLIIVCAMLIATLVLLTQSTKTTTTPTTTTTTTTVTKTKCISPYVQAPSGNCINIMIDTNNCGKLNNICPSSYISCSAGQCSNLSGVELVNATYIWSASVNKSVDDGAYSIKFPFNITLYNTTATSATVTTNGVICFGGCATTFTETALPTSAFSGVTVLPFWDDLYIYENTSQGIYYQVSGTAPNRALIIEYYCSHYLQPNAYYQFQVVFSETSPGIVQYIYYQATDGGASCTIGVQSSTSGPAIQYSFDQANSVTQNMVLTFDTTAGTYTSSSFG